MDFVTDLLITANWKGDNYKLILVIVDQLTKMIHEPGKVTIDVLGLVKVIINVIVRHYGVLELIITDQDSRFISKFWSSL